MGILSYVVPAAFAGSFISMILFVLFGQVTVKKLRKNPSTKTALGLEFASGWDIVNVAQTLALPDSINKVLEDSPLGHLSADSKILSSHTNKFDRFLGALFYWVMMTTAVLLIVMVFI